MSFLQPFMMFGVGSAATAIFFYTLLKREREFIRKKLMKADQVLLMMNIDDYLSVDEDGVTHYIERDDMDFVYRCNQQVLHGVAYHYTAGKSFETRRATCLVCLGSD